MQRGPRELSTKGQNRCRRGQHIVGGRELGGWFMSRLPVTISFRLS
jgi:hypothetical protein